MEVLIIDDLEYKQEQASNILKEFDIKDIRTAGCIQSALINICQRKPDLIISDLGLPRFEGEFVESSLSGMTMLIELAYRKVQIPTIIYSSTDIPQNDLDELKELDYPMLGQAKHNSELHSLLEEYLRNLDINKNDKVVRNRKPENSSN